MAQDARRRYATVGDRRRGRAVRARKEHRSIGAMITDERSPSPKVSGLGWACHVSRQATNMVFVDVARPDGSAIDVAGFNQALGERGIVVRGGPSFRLVTHLDIDDKAIDTTVAASPRLLGLDQRCRALRHLRPQRILHRVRNLEPRAPSIHRHRTAVRRSPMTTCNARPSSQREIAFGE